MREARASRTSEELPAFGFWFAATRLKSQVAIDGDARAALLGAQCDVPFRFFSMMAVSHATGP